MILETFMAAILGAPNARSQGTPNRPAVRLAYMVKTWNERLTVARKKRGLSKAELARSVGVSGPTVTDWESGEIKGLKIENLHKICRVLRIREAWLLRGRGDMALEGKDFAAGADETFEMGPDIRGGRVPVISWVQAGQWCTTHDEFEPGHAEEWRLCPREHGEHTFALRVRGVSMEPKYQNGDIIFVDPDVPAEHGKHVIAKLVTESEATFKQLVVEGEKMFLRPLNPDWPGEKLIPIDENIVICGVVIGKWVDS